MNQQEIYWRQYQLNIETYRGYLELVLKINGLYYAITSLGRTCFARSGSRS